MDLEEKNSTFTDSILFLKKYSAEFSNQGLPNGIFLSAAVLNEMTNLLLALTSGNFETSITTYNSPIASNGMVNFALTEKFPVECVFFYISSLHKVLTR